MNNSEIYILTNNLTLYKELESLNVLDKVTEIMNTCISELQADKNDERVRELGMKLDRLQEEYDELEDELSGYDIDETDLNNAVKRIKELENQIKQLEK